jgi:hypothetical protein
MARSSAPAASDRLAPKRCATPPATRQRPRPDGEISGGEVSCCLPNHVQNECRAAASIGPHQPSPIFSEYTPADGMSAAAKTGTSARPCRQLCYQVISGQLTWERGAMSVLARSGANPCPVGCRLSGPTPDSLCSLRVLSLMTLRRRTQRTSGSFRRGSICLARMTRFRSRHPAARSSRTWLVEATWSLP